MAETTINYINNLPPNYQPFIYKPRNTLIKFLKENHIINLSNYQPSPTEIEILALNLNFIQNKPLRDTETYLNIQKFTEKIDRLIYFDNRPSSHLRGRINHLFKQPWVAPQEDWICHSKIQEKLQDIHTAISQPDKILEEFPPPLQEAINSLRNNTEIYITKADKGGATVIWPTEDYTREALRQPSDTSTYEEIDPKEIDPIIKKLNNTKQELSEWLYALKRITEREKDLILESPSTISPIYFLPKIHKKQNPISKTFPGRPIVATLNCHLHHFDKYITEITNELHPLIPHALIDTLHLLDKLQNRRDPLPKELRIFSADVTNLYPSIDWNIGIEAATNTFKRFHPTLVENAESKNLMLPPSPAMFRTLLTYILKNSYMHFQNKKFFHQTKGTAMGMCISVFFARAFMFEMIRPIRDNPPIHLYHLEIFIDDIFIASTGSDEEIKRMMESISDRSIEYTYDPPSTSCIMLDLFITIENGQFITKNYTKPTASQFYLHAASTHPKSTIDSIPYAQLLRIRRNSTYISDFIKPARKILRTLRLRGYPKSVLDNAYNKAIAIPRYSTLLRKAGQTRSRYQHSIKLILPYNHATDYNLLNNNLRQLTKLIKEFYKDTPSSTTVASLKAQVIHSNMSTINAAFSPLYKKGHKPPPCNR